MMRFRALKRADEGPIWFELTFFQISEGREAVANFLIGSTASGRNGVFHAIV